MPLGHEASLLVQPDRFVDGGVQCDCPNGVEASLHRSQVFSGFRCRTRSARCGERFAATSDVDAAALVAQRCSVLVRIGLQARHPVECIHGEESSEECALD